MQRGIDASRAGLLLVVSVLVVFLGVLFVKANSTIVLFTAGTLAIALCMAWGVAWKEIQSDIVESITAMMPAILILLAVGLLVGSWIVSGTVPIMIYYGLKTLSPGSFLLTSLLICTVMSVMTGTSWGTIGTVGIALMGVSTGLGVPLPYTAGAIVTGAIFGDKLSPLSDTTVMASAVSNVDIVDHIKYMLWTTIPPFLIAAVLYLFLGSHASGGAIEGEKLTLILSTLEKTFSMNPVLLTPPLVVLVLIFLKKPALPVFAVGIALACLLAMIFQGTGLKDLANALNKGYTVATGVDIVDKMLLRGGLQSMLGTVALLIAAAVFGAPLRSAGVIDLLLKKVQDVAKSARSFQVAAFSLHSLLFSITGSYYVTFAVLGPLLRPLYDQYGLHRANLSRMLEDTGTAFAPIVPWSVTGAFIAGTLGVPTGEYILYAPLTYLGMAFALLYSLTGFRIAQSSVAERSPS